MLHSRPSLNGSQFCWVDQLAGLVKIRANSSTLIGFKLNPIVSHSFCASPKLTGGQMLRIAVRCRRLIAPAMRKRALSAHEQIRGSPDVLQK